ncbi:MAG: Omp28-related outer membrane protein, partial [Bacteroidia bacterium]
MKKITKLSILALTVVPFFASSQVNVSTTPSKRVAVLEEFTGNYCTYCPDGHKRADQIQSTYGDKVITLKIQSGSFASTDPIFGGNLKTTHGNYIATQFPVSGWPSGSVNRFYNDDSRSNWSSHVGTITGQDSPINMYIDATVDATTREMIVNVEYYYTANEANTTNYLHIGYYQDNIPAYQYDPGFYPENFYLLEDDVYQFDHCYRANLTPMSSSGTWGEVISSTTTGSTAIVSKTITLPSTFSTFAVEAGAVKVF